MERPSSPFALSQQPILACFGLSVLCFRHTKDSNMTSAIQHGGVMRAALSLDYAEPGEPSVVQFLTSGRKYHLQWTQFQANFLPASTVLLDA